MILLFLFMAYVYILYSQSLNRFYTGSTELKPEERLELHLTKHYGKSKFTNAANDWEILHTIECNDPELAQAIEKHIKRMKMKSAVYISVFSLML